MTEAALLLTVDAVEEEAAELSAMFQRLVRENKADGCDDDEARSVAAAQVDYELATRIANRKRARRGLSGPASHAEVWLVLNAM